MIIHTCTHAHMRTCAHAHMRTCAHAHMRTCAHAHMRTCTHAHMHTYTHMHTNTHSPIHPHPKQTTYADEFIQRLSCSNNIFIQTFTEQCTQCSNKVAILKGCSRILSVRCQNLVSARSPRYNPECSRCWEQHFGNVCLKTFANQTL